MDHTLTRSLSYFPFVAHYSLPDDFYEKLHLLELEAEKEEIKDTVIKDLIQHYAIAIEYFNSKRDDKYHLYLKKMKNFASNPKVLSSLNAPKELVDRYSVFDKPQEEEKETIDPINEQEEPKEVHVCNEILALSPTLQKISKRIHEGNFKTENKFNTKDFIEEQFLSSTKRNELLVNQVSEQKGKLKERLNKLRKRKSLNEIEIQSIIENADSCGGIPIASQLTYEEKLKKFQEERLHLIEEEKEKYFAKKSLVEASDSSPLQRAGKSKLESLHKAALAKIEKELSEKYDIIENVMTKKISL